MPVCAKVRNPVNVASTRKGPSGRLGSEYEPVSLDTVVRTRPVSVCVAVMVTPGSTAPLWSRTVPLMPAVAWAQAAAQPSASASAANDK
jgi:hypothetical protein